MRAVVARVVIHLLHETLLVLWCEQRQVGRNLQGRTVEPRQPLVTLARIAATPRRQGGLRVLRRAAVRTCFCQQAFVVRLGGGEAIGADDLFTRIVAIAMTPCRSARRITAYQRHFIGAPDLFETYSGIAAVIAGITPQRAIQVEVLGREDIER